MDAELPERIAVTGATGFIGRHVTRALIAAGRRPQLMIRGEALPPAMSALATHVDVHRLDLAGSQGDFDALTERVRPDALVHLAGLRAAGRATVDAVASARVNTAGTVGIVAAAHRAGCRRILVFGTAEEYGKQRAPFAEDSELKPSTLYGITKAAATQLCLAMHAAEGSPVAILRPFSVYGPEQPPRMFIAEAVDAAVRGVPFAMSQGSHRRDFVYVDDVVRAVLLALIRPGVEGRSMNLGWGKGERLSAVADEVWRLSGTRAEIVKGGLRDDGTLYDTWADPSVAAAVLGWAPEVVLRDGLERTMSSRRDELARSRLLPSSG